MSDHTYYGSDDRDIYELMHFGKGHLAGGHSGRYPWGSGENPFQRVDSFHTRYDKMKADGLTDSDIKQLLGIHDTIQLRAQVAASRHEEDRAQYEFVKKLYDEGMTKTEIAQAIGRNESYVRQELQKSEDANMYKAMRAADLIKNRIEETDGNVDIGRSVADTIGISQTQMEEVKVLLENDGYKIYKIRQPQTSNQTQMNELVLACPKGTPYKDAYNGSKYTTLQDYESEVNSEEKPITFQYPRSLDSKRMLVRYAGEGGEKQDGIIELRRGVPDLSLGEDRYSQVRIMVDDSHYLKGMAYYSDEIPDGYDVVFNTSKKIGTPTMGDDKNNTVLKKKKSDPDNPFGSTIKPDGQSYYIDPETGERKLSLINKRASEGDWSEWKNAVPSQFLAKQDLKLINKQLDLEIQNRKEQYDTILSLENPVVKKYYLNKFAESCDTTSVHLSAASLPGQKYHVIIGHPSVKDNEVYAPNYENGTVLALIRFPHGSIAEIPKVTVNNNIKAGKKIIGNSIDAVLINSNVAERLSGADFDGDTVMAIPTNERISIASKPALKGLEGFNNKSYRIPDGNPDHAKIMTKANTQREMGKISNLITDMTLKGADDDEIAAAIRHSMVVIDAEKHMLDYKRSEKDNNIHQLKVKYQKHKNDSKAGGASTILSLAKSETQITQTEGQPYINLKKNKGNSFHPYDPTRPEGALIYKKKPTFYVNKKGVLTERTKDSTKMAETDDAFSLVSDMSNPKEVAYAKYANTLKDMANKARVEYANTKGVVYDKNAARIYKHEVDELKAALDIANSNAPKERAANAYSMAVVKAKKAANPDMSKEDYKKLSDMELRKARIKLGAQKKRIEITQKQWEAIQAGAVYNSMLEQILKNTDADRLRTLAMPKTANQLSNAKIARIKSLANTGYSLADIARMMDVSTSTVSKYIK